MGGLLAKQTQIDSLWNPIVLKPLTCKRAEILRQNRFMDHRDVNLLAVLWHNPLQDRGVRRSGQNRKNVFTQATDEIVFPMNSRASPEL